MGRRGALPKLFKKVDELLIAHAAAIIDMHARKVHRAIMAETLGTSVSLIYQALKELNAQGLVQLQHGGTRFPASPPAREFSKWLASVEEVDVVRHEHSSEHMSQSLRNAMDALTVEHEGRRAWLTAEGRYRIEPTDMYERAWNREIAPEELEMVMRVLPIRYSESGMRGITTLRQWWKSLDYGHSSPSSRLVRAGELGLQTISGWSAVYGERNPGSHMTLGDIIPVDKQIGRLLVSVPRSVVECRPVSIGPDRIYDQVLTQFRKEKEKVSEEEWKAVKERERKQHVHGSGNRIQRRVQTGSGAGGDPTCGSTGVPDQSHGSWPVSDSGAAVATETRPRSPIQEIAAVLIERERQHACARQTYALALATTAQIAQGAGAVHGAVSDVPEIGPARDQSDGEGRGQGSSDQMDAARTQGGAVVNEQQ